MKYGQIVLSVAQLSLRMHRDATHPHAAHASTEMRHTHTQLTLRMKYGKMMLSLAQLSLRMYRDETYTVSQIWVFNMYCTVAYVMVSGAGHGAYYRAYAQRHHVSCSPLAFTRRQSRLNKKNTMLTHAAFAAGRSGMSTYVCDNGSIGGRLRVGSRHWVYWRSLWLPLGSPMGSSRDAFGLTAVAHAISYDVRWTSSDCRLKSGWPSSRTPWSIWRPPSLHASHLGIPRCN